MAMGFIGPIFAAISSLFYPDIGAIITRLWYKEKISKRAAIGMCIIIFGGMVIYGPSLFGEMDASNPNACLGYLDGIMSTIGWGTEGAVAGRTMDVSDPDVGIHCRFSFEILFWGILILPALMILTDLPIKDLIIGTLTHSKAMLWIVLAAACHAIAIPLFIKALA